MLIAVSSEKLGNSSSTVKLNVRDFTKTLCRARRRSANIDVPLGRPHVIEATTMISRFLLIFPLWAFSPALPLFACDASVPQPAAVVAEAEVILRVTAVE